MKINRAEAISLTLAAVAVLASVAACSIIVDARDEIRSLMDVVRGIQGAEPVKKKSSWTDAQNVTHSIMTERREGETLDDWCDRHDAAVAAAMKRHPPAVK